MESAIAACSYYAKKLSTARNDGLERKLNGSAHTKRSS